MTAQTLTAQQQSIVLKAYAEVALEAADRGLRGPNSAKAILNAAARIATRLTGVTIGPDEVDKIVHA